MRYRVLSLCLALTAIDCSWDAATTSDFITFGAGNSLATVKAEQSVDLWSPRSMDNNIMFDSERLLAPSQPDSLGSTEQPPPASTGQGISSAQ